MDLEITKFESNIKKLCIIVQGYTFKMNSELKYQQISSQSSVNRKKCPAELRTVKDVTKVLSGILEYNHEHTNTN